MLLWQRLAAAILAVVAAAVVVTLAAAHLAAALVDADLPAHLAASLLSAAQLLVTADAVADKITWLKSEFSSGNAAGVFFSLNLNPSI